MADKRQVRRSIRQLQKIKTWQLAILLLLVGFIAATFLRLNNIGMIDRRDAVMVADKAGDPAIIQARLYDLQRYVTSHMNADMGTIYLENQYKRDSQRTIDAASGDNNPNGNIYKKAQEVCAPKFTHYSQAYLQCTVDYLRDQSPAQDPSTTVALPKADLYRHSFVSPLWTPDFAGWSVLVCLLIIIMIVARIIGLITLRILLKRHDRG